MKNPRRSLTALLTSLVAVAVSVTAAATAHAAVFNPINSASVRTLCLQPKDGSTAHFTPVVLMPCTGGIEQGWELLSPSTDHYYLVNQLSGLCAWDWDGAADTATRTGRVLMDDCNRSSNSEFRHVAAVNGSPLQSRLHFRDSGTCIDAGTATSGTVVRMAACNRSTSQNWLA